MAKLRGSKKHELNAIAETLRLVLSSYTSEQDLIDGINSVIKTAEAWAANGKATLRNDIKPLLHKTPVMCRVYKNTYSGYKGWFDGTVNKVNEDGSLNVTYKMGSTYTEDFEPNKVVIHGT